jgi:6-phosphofructokinase 1
MLSLSITSSLTQPPFIHKKAGRYENPLIHKLSDKCFVKDDQVVQYNVEQQQRIMEKEKSQSDPHSSNITWSFKKAGPMKKIAYNLESAPMKVGIVNAGGLCPGINNVIYDLVYSLEHLYRIDDIYGIQFGYSGFLKYNMLKMNTNNVEGIQHESGSFLGTSRGTLDVEKVASRIMDHDINQLYVIGGDGTHKGAHKLCEYFETNASEYDFSLVCIPKTIDNDISIIDKSFGFETAVDKAKDAIINAYTEARDTEKGLGIVKVMGRNCGWIASSACIASYNVDVCLIPEYGFDFEKVTNYIDFVMNTKGFCVIVIAEGVTCKESSGSDEEDIGLFFKKHYVNNTDYCVKYIDPTYQIRALPANTSDSIYCKMLAQSAVHAAMGGYTDCTIGLVNNSMCLIPLSEIVTKKKYVPESVWFTLLQSTLQPDL